MMDNSKSLNDLMRQFLLDAYDTDEEALRVTGEINVVQGGASAVGEGTFTIDTAGVKEQLPNITCRKVWIMAHEENGEGIVVVGGAGVVAAALGRAGRAHYATQEREYNVSNLNQLWADATVSGCRFHYYYEV